MNNKKEILLVHCLSLLILLPLAVGGWFYPLPQGEKAGTEVGEAWIWSQASPSDFSSHKKGFDQPPAFLDGVDYDSGWLELLPGEVVVLQHNLGGSPDDYRVDLEFRSSTQEGIHQAYPGSPGLAVRSGGKHTVPGPRGAYWRNLNDNNFAVYRLPYDHDADQIRVRIWIAPTPDYDSGWVDQINGSGQLINHLLEADADSYVLDLQHRSADEGVNQGYSAWNQIQPKPSPDQAVKWQNRIWTSQANAAVVAKNPTKQDSDSQIRLRIWTSPNPDYDSEWVPIHKGQEITLNHDLGENPDQYLLDIQYRSVAFSINQVFDWLKGISGKPAPEDDQDSREGAYWKSLTSNDVTVYRHPQDNLAQKVRIRIWLVPEPEPEPEPEPDPEPVVYPYYLPLVQTHSYEP